MAREFLGWSRGLNRNGDETGVWHAVVTEHEQGREHPVAFAACTRHQRFAGQIEPLPENARVCERIGCSNRQMEQVKRLVK